MFVRRDMQMNNKLKKLNIVAVAAMLVAGLYSTQAGAVPNPRAIQWKASPTVFVTSLYRGVLGRAPESRAVVVGWARQVNSRPGSRLSVFWHFVNSPEYQQSRWARLKREYFLYRESKPNRRWNYFAAKFAMKGHRIGGGPYTLGVARALVGYYQDFYPRW
jgi:hypothetical protein